MSLAGHGPKHGYRYGCLIIAKTGPRGPVPYNAVYDIIAHLKSRAIRPRIYPWPWVAVPSRPVYICLSPTRRDLTQGQWPEGRLLCELRDGELGLEPKLEPFLTMLVIIAHLKVTQPKPGAYRPRICTWLWTQRRAETRPPSWQGAHKYKISINIVNIKSRLISFEYFLNFRSCIITITISLFTSFSYLC